ncbi:retrotransposon protein, putative, ty1-copia subclass [Tanacetum coccineum]
MLFTMRETYVDRNPKMTHPVQNINHSAFMSMFEREKLSRNNFNDWFRQLKLVLRVEKKMFVIEQPLPAAPAADSAVNVLLEWNAVYDAYNEIKGYVDQLEPLGYVLRQDLIVGLILNGLTKDFSGFVRNYNMHNTGKTVGELHAMLFEYEKGIPKKAETPQVMMIKGGKIQKANKKSLKVKGRGKANGKGKDKQVYIPKPKNPKPSAKEHPTKDDACHHYKELTPPYTPQHNRVSERRNRTLLDMVRSMMNLTTLSLSFWDYALESATLILNMVLTKKVDKTPYELWYGKVPNLSYLKETIGYYFYFPLENKIVVAGYVEFFQKNLITQEVSGRDMDLEEIQDEDTSPSEITSEIPIEVEGFEPPQEEDIMIRRSERIRRAPNGLSLNVEVEEHSLGDLNEPTSYKAAMLDYESNKWIDAMNAEI